MHLNGFHLGGTRLSSLRHKRVSCIFPFVACQKSDTPVQWQAFHGFSDAAGPVPSVHVTIAMLQTLYFCFVPALATAANRAILADYAMTIFTADDGVPSARILSIVQDRDRLLWIATSGG